MSALPYDMFSDRPPHRISRVKRVNWTSNLGFDALVALFVDVNLRDAGQCNNPKYHSPDHATAGTRPPLRKR